MSGIESEDVVGEGDQGVLVPIASHSVPGSGDKANVAAQKIGEPSLNFSIRDSVAYSHNYFEAKEVNDESYALCLLCDEEEKKAEVSGKTLTKSKGKKKKLLKTSDGTTKRKFSV